MVFQFKIQIKTLTKPPVWRRVQISADATFAEFHKAIQYAFGWDFAHLYMFSENGYGSDFTIEGSNNWLFDDDDPDAEGDNADQIMLREIFKKEKETYTYIYDFGDDWIHKITLEKILKEDISHPICLAGKGKCPPEDCGGPWAYEAFKSAINDPNHPEYEDLREWIGLEEEEVWDIHEFNLEEVNEIFSRW